MPTAAELQFLQDVLVWPGEQSSGWINLHVNSKSDDPKRAGRPYVNGWPYKSVDDFTNRAGWIDNGSPFFNVWMCMSQQSVAGTSRAGKPKAIRLKENATWVKAIWIDVDVKVRPADWDQAKPWPHYETFREAWGALREVFKKVGLPEPSAVVNSGGGLHVYWIADRPLTPQEWYPYADGLKALLLKEGVKCDAGLTTDVARLLRVPGTLNHKYDPPQKVELLNYTTPYSFESSLPFLKNFHTAPQRIQHSFVGKFTDLAPDPAFAALDPHSDTLQAGIDLKVNRLIDPEPIFAKSGCAWLRDALATGGKDFDNPQWHLSVLCTAFMEDGNDIAHQISKGHADYTEDGTQAEFDRALADRENRGLGYPACSTIKGAGSTSCEGCPHFIKGKSPLNLRPVVVPAVTAAVKQRGMLTLPKAYDLDEDGKICLLEPKINSKGEYLRDVQLQLFHCKIDNARVFKDPDQIDLHHSTDKGNWKWSSFHLEDLVGTQYDKVLARQGVLFCSKNKTKLEEFFMSFMSKMYEAQEARKASTSGWYYHNGVIEGFAAGGTYFKCDGTQEPSGTSDRQMAARYAPTGKIEQWHETASYIFRQERPEFDVIIALAFAAPLMQLLGEPGVVLAAMGQKGAGKSYALDVSAAVWGHPKTTKEVKTTTEKSLMNRLGKTPNLPGYWDEISDERIRHKAHEFIQQVSTAVEGGTLTPGRTQRERGVWYTAININGNESFRDYVVSKQKNHAAGLRRILEYWVLKNVPNPKGQVQPSEAKAALGLLDYNYGTVGQEYAEYLVGNLAKVQATLDDTIQMLNQTLHPDKEEVMWVSLCAALIAGSILATELPHPVEFTPTRIKDFLIDVFLENRKYSGAAHTNPLETSYAEDHLAQYLKDRLMETIWTTGTPSGRGRAARVEYRRINVNGPLPHGINVRWDTVDSTLRISKTNFQGWCKVDPTNRNASTIFRALEGTYGMVEQRCVLASGTPFHVSPEYVCTIDVRNHPDLMRIMTETHPDNFTVPVTAEAAE